MNKILSELNDLTTLGNTTNNSSNNLNCEESGEGDGNSEEFASAPAATLRRVIYKLFPLPYKPLKLKIKERMKREEKQLQYINAATAAAVISENGRRQRTCAVAYRMSKSSNSNPYSSITTTNIVNTTTGSGNYQNKGGKLKRKLRTEESSSSSSSEDDAMFVETDDEVVGGKGQQQEQEGVVKQEAKKARRTVVRDSEEEEEQGGEDCSKMNPTAASTKVEIKKAVTSTTATSTSAPTTLCIDLTATPTGDKQAPFGKSDGVNGWSIYRREGWVLTNNTDTAVLQEDINTAIHHIKEENEEITVTEELASDMYTQALQGAQYVHTTVYKAFRKCDMIGWVVGYLPAVVNEGEELWHVVFVDGDEEDMDAEEVSACPVAVTVVAAVSL